MYGGGQVFGSPMILNSSISGYPRISGRPTINRSHISGTAQVLGMPYIKHSVLSGNCVVNGNPTIYSSEVGDNARILDNSALWFCRVTGNAMVTDTAKLVGTEDSPIELSNWDYVCEGRWTRRPLNYVASSGFVVSESVGRKVVINCTNNTVEKWLNRGAGRRYGRLVGLTNEQTDEIQYLVEQIKRVKDVKGYEVNGGWSL